MICFELSGGSCCLRSSLSSQNFPSAKVATGICDYKGHEEILEGDVYKFTYLGCDHGFTSLCTRQQILQFKRMLFIISQLYGNKARIFLSFF